MQKKFLENFTQEKFFASLTISDLGAHNFDPTYAIRKKKFFLGVIFDAESGRKKFFRNSNFLVILGISVDTNQYVLSFFS